MGDGASDFRDSETTPSSSRRESRRGARSSSSVSLAFSGLGLGTGASASALIGQTPVNFAAAMAGWQRVAPGDRANSFLIHKLEGRLASEYGERMPLDRKRVPSFLQYIVGAWVDAGAPTNDTWVPGTDN